MENSTKPSLAVSPRALKPLRPSIAAQLAATAVADARAIDALERGQTWTRIVVNANDVKLMEEAPASMRVHVERLIVPGVALECSLQWQDGGEWAWSVVEMNVYGEEAHSHESGSEVVSHYAFWGEFAERHIEHLRREMVRSAESARNSYALDEPAGERLCYVCSYDAGGTLCLDEMFRSDTSTIAACPICGRREWLTHVDYIAGLPDRVVEAVLESASGNVSLKVAA